MGFDELDELLNKNDELEAAFRELDAKLKMDEMRRDGKPTRKATSTSKTGTKTRDPLKDLKAAVDGEAPKKTKAKAKGPKARYLVVVCPSCGGKNRVPLERLRKSLPVCGRCKTDLSFERA